MIKLLLLFILPLSLFASKILSYNIYDRTDRVDVMITFDTPYNGVIKQSVSNGMITIKLQDASIESTKRKKLSSKYIKSLTITPMANYTKIIATIPSSVMLQASKTSDAYGLRLRFKTKVANAKNKSTKVKLSVNSPLSSLPTKKQDDISKSYYIVIFILMIGILILFYIKKKIPNQTQKKSKSKSKYSWLFKENNQTQAQTQEVNPDVSIRFQKSIDTENSVVMLDFGEQSYLVLMGKSNVLLDKYRENKPVTQNDFETILQDRHKELDDFLHNEEAPSTTKEPLQAYKERAAAIIYEDN